MDAAWKAAAAALFEKRTEMLFSAFFSSAAPSFVKFYKNGRARPLFLEKNEKNRFLFKKTKKYLDNIAPKCYNMMECG